MKFKVALLLALNLLFSAPGQEARFFRIAGPVASAITAFSPDGYVTWTNTPTNATFTVQTSASLVGSSNWVDYIQVPATNPATTHRLYDPNPPAGMALIPAGSFTMGDTFGDGGGGVELPLHKVYVSAFYMDRYEMTEVFWNEVKAWNGGNGYSYDYSDSGQGKAANHPAHSMTWYDVVKWCNARAQQEGLVPCYYTESGLTSIYKTGQVVPYVNWSANGYRLPTEAEWEKAARGGASGRRFPWTDSDTITHGRANYSAYPLSAGGYAYDVNPTSGFHPTFETGGTPYTSPVGYFSANGFGLYDMAGNVWEWCWDWDGSYSSGSQADPRGPASGSSRVSRGGSWSGYAIRCRPAHRIFRVPSHRFNYGGFRCVRAAGQ